MSACGPNDPSLVTSAAPPADPAAAGPGAQASGPSAEAAVSPVGFRDGWEAALRGEIRRPPSYVFPGYVTAWFAGYDDALRGAK